MRCVSSRHWVFGFFLVRSLLFFVGPCTGSAIGRHCRDILDIIPLITSIVLIVVFCLVHIAEIRAAGVP